MAPWTGPPADLLSLPPSSPSHTSVDIPVDIYYDPRTVQGPSRHVKAPVNSIGAGAVLARSPDGIHCAVAGKDYIKILRVGSGNGLLGPSALGDGRSVSGAATPSRSSSRRARLLGRGPDGAAIHEELNMRMSQNTSSTDIGWGHGAYANKVVVTTMSGNIIIADTVKAKIERNIKEHTRSINGLAFTPHLPHVFATCSQDEYVKLWDLRTENLEMSFVSINHKSSTRAVCFSPQPSTPMHAIVALGSGAFYKWDYRKGGLGLLDRFTAAHAGAIMGMDWIGPSLGSDSQGWLATGGLDKTVKIWDMSERQHDQNPVHVLHTAEKVKRVAWRPGHDSEVAIVPTTPGVSARPGVDGETSDADRIEIWDVRRPWVPKYVLEGGEGAVMGMVWAGPDALWATYSNGMLVQHDVRHSYRPLDSIPRSALAWEPRGSITYANEAITPYDHPFDDVKPAMKSHLIERGWKDKGPADPEYAPLNQTYATVSLPVFDLQGFVDLARGYVLSPNANDNAPGQTTADVCLINAKVAHHAEYYRAAQTWLMLNSLLTPLTTFSPPQPPIAEPAIFASPAPRLSSLPPLHSTPPASMTLPLPITRLPFRPGDRRTVSTSSIAFSQSVTTNLTPTRPPNSSENSPASENCRRYPPSSTPTSARPSISRKSSAVTRTSRSSAGRRKRSGSQEHRSLSRNRGRSASIESSTRSRASSRALSQHVGDGALDSSSDEDEEAGRLPGLGITGSGPTSILRSGPGHSAKSSLSSNTLNAPNEADELAHRRHIHNGTVPHLYLSDDAGALGDDNYNSESSSSTGRESPRVPAPPSSPVQTHKASLDRPKISKQDSRSSIKTAVPSSSRRHLHPSHDASSGGDTEGKTGLETDSYVAIGSSTDGEFGGSTRRPSPAGSGSERRHNRGESFAGVSVKPTEEAIPESPHIRSRLLNSNSTSPHPSLEPTPLIRDRAPLPTDRVPSFETSRSQPGIVAADHASDEELDERGRKIMRTRRTQPTMDPGHVAEDEKQLRQGGWAAMREAFDYYSEKGDVQMCIALASVANGELLSSEEAGVLDRLSIAYVDLLSRLRLHPSAAYVRKYGASSDLNSTTKLDTIFYTACGKCRKPLMTAATAPSISNIPGPLNSPNTAANGSLAHRRNFSLGRQNNVQARSHSQARSLNLHLGGGPVGEKGLSEVAEGGFGFCATCKKATAKCSLCRLPVRGLHFWCAVCSHGGHHDCYRNYYLRRPMMPSLPKDQSHTFGMPGCLGWGLASTIKNPDHDFGPDSANSSRFGRRDSDASESEPSPGKGREREGSLVAVGLTSVASIGAAIGIAATPKSARERDPEKEKDRERDRDKARERERTREPEKKRLMGHPCAAGCGHICWMTNDALPGV